MVERATPERSEMASTVTLPKPRSLISSRAAASTTWRVRSMRGSTGRELVLIIAFHGKRDGHDSLYNISVALRSICVLYSRHQRVRCSELRLKEGPTGGE